MIPRNRQESWDQDSGDKAHVTNRHLPRFRQQRKVARNVIVANLPSLLDATPASRSKLLIRKVRLCSFIFSWDGPDNPQDAKDKEIKRNTLLELVNYFTMYKPSLSEEELTELFEMISCNLFRPLPPNTQDLTGQFNPEEDEPQAEPSWPHLQIIYEILVRVVNSAETDRKLLEKQVNRRFVSNLIELFDTEDRKEREALKSTLHRIYANFVGLRTWIRKAINNVMYKFIYETDRHNGIAELLEIIASIINGFSLPLKEQHKQFLAQVLLPLHKVTHVAMFHPQLSYCVTQFLEKDSSLAPIVVGGLLKFWPITCSKKEVMFLNELEDVLDRVKPPLGDALELSLFKRVASCVSSPHFQVSERALYFVHSEAGMKFINSRKDVFMPIICQALFTNTHARRQLSDDPDAAKLQKMSDKKIGHWNPSIIDLTSELIKLFQKLDADLMKQLSQEYLSVFEAYAARSQKRREQWEAVEKLASTGSA